MYCWYLLVIHVPAGATSISVSLRVVLSAYSVIEPTAGRWAASFKAATHKETEQRSCLNVLLHGALLASKTWRRINTRSSYVGLRLLVIHQAQNGLRTFSSRRVYYCFSATIIRRAAVVVSNDTFHKEQEWDSNLLLAPILRFIQTCHAVHRLFNGTFLCFQVPSSPRFMKMYFWALQFSYNLKLVITSDWKSYL